MDNIQNWYILRVLGGIQHGNNAYSFKNGKLRQEKHKFEANLEYILKSNLKETKRKRNQ